VDKRKHESKKPNPEEEVTVKPRVARWFVLNSKYPNLG
jgi:hypothetical protein